MDVINNRYHILKKLDSHIHNVEEFLAVDLWSKERELNLKIVPASALSDEVFSFIKDGFINIRTIDNYFYLKNYGFASLYLSLFRSFSTRPEEKCYILTTEYLSDYTPLLTFVNSCSMKDFLEITVSVFRALTYIGNMGFEYTAFTPSDIFVVKTKTGFRIRIKDIITKKLEDPFSVHFAEAADAAYEDKNIEMIGYLILSILAGKYIKSNFLRSLAELKKNFKKKNLNKSDLKIFECLCNVAKKAAVKTKESNKLKISSLLSDINVALGLNYTITAGEVMKPITFRPRIVGRERYIKAVLKSAGEINSGNALKNVFIIKGPFGIGKTRFLGEAGYELSLECINVYFNYNLKTHGSKHFWDDFLEKAFCNNLPAQNISEKTAILKNIEYINNQRQKKDIPHKYEHLKFKVFNEGKNLFFKLVGRMPVFLIIDDLHLANDFVLETILYLSAEITKQEKLGIIFSYDETAAPASSKFESFLKTLQLHKNVETFSFSNFSEEETTIMLKNILLLKYAPKKTGSVLYKQTKGYPLFIIEAVKELIMNNIMYIDKRYGMWHIRERFFNENISKKISLNIEETLKNQIKFVPEKEKEMLLTMALFQNTFKLEYLYGLIPMPKNKIDKSIKILIDKALIFEIHSGNKVEYSITNKTLRDILYEDTNQKIKIAGHKKIIKILQKDEAVNRNELIWHLEKSGNKSLAAKYCMENVDNALKNKKINEAILNYGKILELMEESDIEMRCKTMLTIAKLYYQLGLREKERETLQIISEIIPQINNYELLSLYYYQSANYEYISEHQALVLNYSEKLKLLYEKCKTPIITINLHGVNCMYYKLSQNIEALKKNSYKVLKLCGDKEEYLIYKCDALVFLGYANYIKRNYKESFKYYKYCLETTRQCNYTKCELTALCNIAIAYAFSRNGIHKAFKYMHLLISKARSMDIISIEIYALLNYAIMLVEIHNSKLAYKYVKEASAKIIANNILTLEYPKILTFMNTSMNLCKYNDFFKYRKEAVHFLKNTKLENKLLYDFLYYNLLAETCQYLWCHTKGFRLLKRLLKLKDYRSDVSLALIYFRIEASRIILNRKTDIGNLIKYFDIYAKKLNKNSQSDYSKIISKSLLEFTIALTIQRSDIDFSPLILKLLEYKDIRLSTFQYIAMLYFEAYIDKENEGELLSRAIQISKHKNNTNLLIPLDIRLGLYHKNKGDNILAVFNFLEAEDEILELFKNIPKEYRLPLYNNSFYNIPFNAVQEFIEGKDISKINPVKKRISEEELNTIISASHIKLLQKDIKFKKALTSRLMQINGFGNMTHTGIFAKFNNNFEEQMRKFMQFLSFQLLAPQFGLLVLNRIGKLESVALSKFHKDVKILYDLIIKFGYDKIGNVQKKIKKQCMIIPIKKKNSNGKIYDLLGFMVFVSGNTVNNFSSGGLKTAKDVSHFLAMILENNILKQTAFYDFLTGALTRKYLDISLKNILKNSIKTNSVFSIIIYDLDKFKTVNDSFGHHIGDMVLQNVAKTVFKELKEGQLLGRFGGEEFVIILPNIGMEKVCEAAENFRTKVEEAVFDEIKITVSLGISCYPEHGKTIPDLLLKADQALYKAKNSGRNRSCLWSYSILSEQITSTAIGGLLLADETKYSETVNAAAELADIPKIKQPRHKMFSDFAAKIMHLFNAESCAVITVSQNKKTKALKLNIAAKLGFVTYTINEELVFSVLNTGLGLCRIDWDNVAGKNIVSNIPEWNSVAVAPLTKNENIAGVVYLASPEKKREFNSTDLNLLKFIADIVSANI
ncbi:diguanylate cyclase [Treponema pedis]|uniref:diguanylate cyclase n=1 Tax=Treponema pedis TaxID=409322 RepID=UPI00197EAB31|nr:diguanylate cyclase [Treponema pedis]QSI05839.1 diguanylate cyclase [Treponema pedis]